MASSSPPEHAASDRQNNFDALRLALATLVLFSHSYVLAGDAEPIGRLTRHQLEGGSIAVDGFFVISGFLITRSWIVSRSTDDFLGKRIRRIYPGFLAATVVSIIIAAICSPTVRYLKFLAFATDDFVRTALFLTYGALDNPAAFPSNPYPNAVNGSLWTLQPELFCYLLVAAAGILGALSRRRIILAIGALIYAVYCAQTGTRLGATPTSFTRLLIYFVMGALAYLYRPTFGRPMLVVGSILLMIVGNFIPPLLALTTPITGTYLLLSVAFSRRIRLYNAAARGDLSYGVYLYAFVVQQATVAVLHLAHRPLVVFAVALPVTYLAAWCSWHAVERRFIRRAGSRSSALTPAPADQVLVPT